MDRVAAKKKVAEDAKAKLAADILAVENKGGIYGYDGGIKLTPEQVQFHSLLTSFVLNKDTADEVLDRV